MYIDFTLPARIQDEVTLVVEFIDEESSQTEDEEFTDSAAFSNTLDVHYLIPSGQLPGFTMFRVRIALQVEGERGPWTGESNPICKLKNLSCTNMLLHV